MNKLNEFLSNANPQPAGSSVLAMSDFSSPTSFSQASYVNNNSASSSKKVKKFFKNSPYLPFIIVIVLVVLVAGVAINNVMKGSSGNSVLSSDNRANIDKPVAEQLLNRSFDFPLRDGSGKEVSKLKYEIQSAELRNDIIVKGQRASAVKGRTFLIVNLKITNTFDKSVQLNSKDYIRLIVGSSSEKLAADIHNDPVDVQAISTKYTRLGFPINDNEKSLILQVGEIEGPKQEIKLNLK